MDDQSKAPEDLMRLLKQALQYHQNGLGGQAAEIYQQIIDADPNNADALHFLGLYYGQIGEIVKGKPLLERAVELRPDAIIFIQNAAKVFKDNKDYQQAIAFYKKAIKVNSEIPEFYLECAKLYQELGDKFNYHLHQGVAESLLRHNKQAIEHFNYTVEQQPTKAIYYFNLATAEHNAGCYQKSLEHYNKCIQLQPDQYSAIWGRARMNLMLGNFEQGWQDWQQRWHSKSLMPYKREFAGKKWLGEVLENKLVYLYMEQGIGDHIQFLRYIPMVAERVTNIYVETTINMQRLVEEIPGVTGIVHKYAQPPNYDAYAALMDLGYIFKTTCKTIPNKVPYLATPSALDVSLPESSEKAAKLKVGVAWKGNPQHKNDIERSIPFDIFRKLFTVEKVRFYSLQIDDEKQYAQQCAELIDLSGMITDFADTAALAAQLDVIICVDTAVAHLCGAFGFNTWVLIQDVPDWRWLTEGDSSPWYPTIRLFRQQEPFHWDDVIQKVKDELTKLV
jgi:tetratricopeptide (TPR) repeat protein